MTEVIERDATLAPVKRDTPTPAKPPKLLDQVRERIRVLHYARATENTYLHWIKFYIHFHGLRHPRDMGAAEVEAFLSHLATVRDVAAGTQNQAMHAILFLYRQVLGVELGWLDSITRAIDAVGAACAAIQRLEQRTGLDLYHRPSKREKPDFHKHDSVVHEVVSRIAGMEPKQ